MHHVEYRDINDMNTEFVITYSVAHANAIIQLTIPKYGVIEGSQTSLNLNQVKKIAQRIERVLSQELVPETLPSTGGTSSGGAATGGTSSSGSALGGIG